MRPGSGALGAGLAGLSAAVRLRAAGCDVHVSGASDHAGGRLTTARMGGFVVDRGFQVLNIGYPRAADLDLPALDLGWFDPGSIVRVGPRAHRVVDPRSRPSTAPGTVTAPIGSCPEKAALAAFPVRAGCAPVDRLLRRPERTAEGALWTAGLRRRHEECFLRPFLAGAPLEAELTTSSRHLDLLWRSFVRAASSRRPPGGRRSASDSRPGSAGSGSTSAPPSAQSPPDPCGRTRKAAGPTRSSSPPIPRRRHDCCPGSRRRLRVRWRRTSTSCRSAVVGAADRARATRRAAGQQRRAHRRPAVVQPAYSRDGRALVASSSLSATAEPELRDAIALSHDVATRDLEHLTTVTVANAQPAARPPLELRRPVDLGHGIYVCGEHRGTPSIQGAMTSGARAAHAVLRALRPSDRLARGAA